MKIKFCGAAKVVTGSCFLIEFNKKKILVDCGMFQGRKKVTRLNYKPFMFNPEEISYMFLTHAHIDHSGLIPKLVKEGFKGKIYATSATIDLAKALLEDSAHIHESETERENRRRHKMGLPERKPLYTMKQAANSFSYFYRMKYNQKYKIGDSLEVRFRDAGHILGSAIIELWIKEKEKKKLVFSGDLGQWDVPIVKDPTMIDEADYVVVESTYGDRIHEDKKIREKRLLEICEKAYDNNGRVMIPTFAVERSQELLYSFKEMITAGKFPKGMKIFLDSPLAIKVTEIFKLHKECYDHDALFKNKDPFKMKNLEYTKSVKESKKINHHRKPCVIMAGSGMCTAGRIRHHFRHGLNNPHNTVIFVGYQAESTLGRVLLEGSKEVKMMGLKVKVKANIEKIDGYSAHADKNELVKWVSGFKKKPKKVFIVHGEPESQKKFKKNLAKEGLKCEIPSLGQSFSI